MKSKLLTRLVGRCLFRRISDGLSGGDVEYAVKLGTAYAALKHSIPGDLNWATREEADELINGRGNIRVVR